MWKGRVSESKKRQEPDDRRCGKRKRESCAACLPWGTECCCWNGYQIMNHEKKALIYFYILVSMERTGNDWSGSESESSAKWIESFAISLLLSCFGRLFCFLY